MVAVGSIDSFRELNPRLACQLPIGLNSTDLIYVLVTEK
jgi:hypothetical protein